MLIMSRCIQAADKLVKPGEFQEAIYANHNKYELQPDPTARLNDYCTVGDHDLAEHSRRLLMAHQKGTF